MADLKHLKVQPLGGNGDGDPLAELTRIMGMNPPSSASRDAASEDFGIDLEREMLGDFGANDSRPPEAAAVRAAPAPDAPIRTFAPPSNDSWKSAFSDLAPLAPAVTSAPAEPVRPASAPIAGTARPAAAQPSQSPRPGVPAEPPVLRSDWSAPRAPEPVAAPAADKAEEDPFERLAAFSRQWLDRRQADSPAEGTRPAGTGFRMPEQPAGPVSAVPSAGRQSAPPIPVLRPAAPAAAASPAPSSPAVPTSPPVAASPVASSPAPAQQAVPARQQPADEQPAAPARMIESVAAPEDKIFDPFAELVAMAGHARPAAKPEAPKAEVPRAEAAAGPAAPQRQGTAPAAGAAPDAGLHNQSFIANPSIIARRTNWQSVPGGAAAVTPRETPAAAAPVVPVSLPAAPAAEAAAPAEPEPVEASAADFDVSAADPHAGAVSPVRQEEAPAEPNAAPDPTWDAISDWVNRPSERNGMPAQGADEGDDDLDDDFFFRKDTAGSEILPPVARIPELAPQVSDQEDFSDFGDDFDLESLLRSELEGEGLRSGAAQVDNPAAEPVSAAAPTAPVEARSVQPASDGPADEPAAARDSAPQEAVPAMIADLARDDDTDGPAGIRDDGGMPEVDTVEVPMARYVVADEIDLPELAVEDEIPQAVAADDIDADFGGGFEDRAETRPASVMAGAAAPSVTSEGWSRVSPRQPEPGRGGRDEAVDDLDAAFDEAVRSWADAESEKDIMAERGAAPAWLSMRPDAGAVDDDDGFDPEYHPVPASSQEARPVQRRRGFVAAAVVAGVAVLGGIGAFALSLGGGGGDDEPVLVRADPDPVKVKPEQPGGATVPNQDKAVYERFTSGDSATQTSQEKLLSTQEEPVNLAVRTVPITAPAPLIDPTEAESADELPGAFGQGADAAGLKSEDRVEAADEIDNALAGEVAVVTPRRVRTMVVRPDGTMVPREEPLEEAPSVVAAIAEPEPEAPAPLAQAPIRTSPAAPPAASTAAPADNAAATPAPATETPARQEPPVRRVETSTITREQATPVRGPVAPARPSDQPVDIVGNAGAAAQGTQVAAAQPVPAVTAQSSEWVMQIASQPSPEGAQASYADLSRRFASVLNGRGVNIVKAEIAGKGTFWRVRIPTGSRADANALCERYKAAGGSCFVSR
ncbi:SPOR domain-containing protein [Aquibium sp. ELW1220]|uniref:SPOR domain-containing protein n=1 Tax=Aquibium sp. ELW1220 TaxID=2976766 RepID=UPI0025B0F129|nr:SPOR domain-containing protein [Aquibium sp. ELW1220]MDN2583777.1 SPOR domain-containing protein [Aquibium sp. ELW1220]